MATASLLKISIRKILTDNITECTEVSRATVAGVAVHLVHALSAATTRARGAVVHVALTPRTFNHRKVKRIVQSTNIVYGRDEEKVHKKGNFITKEQHVTLTLRKKQRPHLKIKKYHYLC